MAININPEKLVVLETLEDKRVAEYVRQQMVESVAKMQQKIENDYVADWKAWVESSGATVQDLAGNPVALADVTTIKQIDELISLVTGEPASIGTPAEVCGLEPTTGPTYGGIQRGEDPQATTTPSLMTGIPEHIDHVPADYNGLDRSKLPDENRLPDWITEPVVKPRKYRAEPRAKLVQSAFNKTFTRDNPKKPGYGLPIKRADAKNPEGLSGRQLKKARKALQREQKAVEAARTQLFEGGE